MSLKPQDVVIALKLSLDGESKAYAQKASELGMSASEVHAAEARLVEAKLLSPDKHSVLRKPLMDFLVYGVPHAFAVAPKELTRGVPTAWSAPVMSGEFKGNNELPPIWPDPVGTTQGLSVKPLYRNVPEVAQASRPFYDLLALVDALRIGRARERAFAEEKLRERIMNNGRD